MHFLRIGLLVLLLFLTGCSTQQPNTATPAAIVPPLSAPSPTPNPAIPNFNHIVVIIFENKEFESVIDSPDAPYINQLARENTLLTEYYAITHPSLPNYIALIGGDTYGYTTNCTNCPVTATNLADLVERSGRSWMTYQESMPGDCVIWDFKKQYASKHNPFMYFSSILNDKKRCREHIEELSNLFKDEAKGDLANFIFITPNLCNAGHDCTLTTADTWLGEILPSLEESLQAESDNYLIIVTWDEGSTDKSCCELQEKAGGKIATILISPQAKNEFKDTTQYTTYSLLRTISEAWGLPLLGHAADDSNVPILTPWK